MFDTRAYKDLVTLWIKGFPTLHFEIQVKREQLEVLQVRLDFTDFHCYFIIKARDTLLASGKVNEKISIIIKTYRRHNCLDRLVDSIRKYYPYISIIIADDSPGNGPTGEFLTEVFTSAAHHSLCSFHCSISPPSSGLRVRYNFCMSVFYLKNWK